MLKTMIGALALATSVSAVAGESRVVRYDDLNLATPAGMERLERRIDSAARSVCRTPSTERVMGLAANAEIQACIAAAKAKAAPQVAALGRAQARGG